MAPRKSTAASDTFWWTPLGLVIKSVVHPASVQDREGGKLLLDGIQTDAPQLKHI